MVSGIAPPDAGLLAGKDFTDDDVRRLETIASRAWPAAERIVLDGWLLRASGAPMRRVNSVLAQGDKGGMTLDERIEAVEDFYAGRNAPARFQLTSGSLPRNLDDALARRGYAIEAPTDVQTAATGSLFSAPPGPEIDLRTSADAAWMDVHAGAFNRGVSDVLGRIQGRKGFLSYRLRGDVVGVSLGVVEGAWLGIFGMRTRPAYRNRGIGGAMLAGLAAWALAESAAGVYLQVEQDNPDARRLYKRHGFRNVYSYHYRSLFPDDRNRP